MAWSASKIRALFLLKVQPVTRTYKPRSVLNKLQYSPTVNPLLDPREVSVRRRQVRTSGARSLIDPQNGEIAAIAAVHTIQYRDDQQFVKIFADGVKAAFGLTRTASKVFERVLEIYESTPMQGGYAEAVELFWFGAGLSGRDIGMSEYSYKRGLRELIDKGFLYPRIASSFWVNPSLFFKGDRVAFINEYRRDRPNSTGPTQPQDASPARLGQTELPL
jgi:hypothetical protein